MGLSLIAYEPVTEIGLYARQFVDDVTGKHDGYTHTINAVGGFEQATFNLRGTRPYLDDWFEDGLFRRVVLFNPQAIPVWEGFINRMRYTVGTLQRTKAMDQLYNRIYMKYSPKDSSTTPATARQPTTLIVDDLASQAEWGVKAHVMSGGERTDEEVYAWARAVLNKHSTVRVGESVNTQATEPAFMEVECKGYYHTLKWLPFSTSETGSVLGHQLITEVLLYFDSVNGSWVSTSTDWMDHSFLLVDRDYDELESCWGIINSVIGKGGKGGERWVGGLYQDRMMIYKAAEAQSALYGEYDELYRSLEDTNQFIYDSTDGTEMKPWDLVPDRLLRTVDVR